MIEKHREKREQVEIFSIEEFVPANHLLRKIDSTAALQDKTFCAFHSAKIICGNLFNTHNCIPPIC